MERRVREELQKNKVSDEQLEEFNKKIRNPSGKLAYSDLKKLNSVYKRNYVNMVTQEDN